MFVYLMMHLLISILNSEEKTECRNAEGNQKST